MARKNASVLEDIMGIAELLPWKAGVAMAVVAYLVLHYFATKSPLTTNPAELKAIGKTLVDSMVHGIWTTLASVLQYVVPLALLVGAGASFMRQRRHVDATLSGAPTCPRCGSAMVMRTAKSGSNAGNSFWGCSNFPGCRGIRN